MRRMGVGLEEIFALMERVGCRSDFGSEMSVI